MFHTRSARGLSPEESAIARLIADINRIPVRDNAVGMRIWALFALVLPAALTFLVLVLRVD